MDFHLEVYFSSLNSNRMVDSKMCANFFIKVPDFRNKQDFFFFSFISFSPLFFFLYSVTIFIYLLSFPLPHIQTAWLPIAISNKLKNHLDFVGNCPRNLYHHSFTSLTSFSCFSYFLEVFLILCFTFFSAKKEVHWTHPTPLLLPFSRAFCGPLLPSAFPTVN